jgi:hypothetical protein
MSDRIQQRSHSKQVVDEECGGSPPVWIAESVAK